MKKVSFEFKPSSRIEPRVKPAGLPPINTADAMALSFYLNINVYEIEKIAIKNTMYPE